MITVFPVAHFEFEISMEMVGSLMKLASVHYDFTCKNLVNAGGLLFGWKNLVGFSGEEKAVITATFRELDLVLKILEFNASCRNPPIYLHLVHFHSLVHLALESANVHTAWEPYDVS